MHTEAKRFTYIAAIAMLSAAALYLAAPFLIPIVLAALLAMLLTRISELLERKGIGRAGSSAIAVLLLIGVVALLGIVLSWQNITVSKSRMTRNTKRCAMRA